MKFLAIFAIASLAFAAGWVTRGKQIENELEDRNPHGFDDGNEDDNHLHV